MAVTTKSVNDVRPAVVSLSEEQEKLQIGKSLMQLGLERLRRDKLSLSALGVLIVMVLLAILAAPISTYVLRVDYAKTDIGENQFLPPGSVANESTLKALDLKANTIYSLVTVGGLGSSTRAFMFDTPPLDVKEGMSMVRFINASPNTRTVDIYLGTDTKPVASSILYGKASKFIELPAGAKDFTLRIGGMAATEPPIAEVKGVDFQAGGSTVLVMGSKDARENKPLTVKAIKTDLSSPNNKARVQLVQAHPDVDGINIELNNRPVAANLNFGSESTIVVDPNKVDFRAIRTNAPLHVLGTDNLGRDQLARLLYGGQVSLGIGFLAAFLVIGIGVMLGIVTGYYGGWIDDFMSWLITTIASIPFEYSLIFVAVVFRPTPAGLIVVLGSLGWLSTTRLARGETFSIREREYIISARAIGASPLRIMFMHIAPNLFSVVIIALALQVGGLILAESALSFLGLGIQQPMASWGNMLTNAQDYLTKGPHLIFPPGLLISITVLCCFIIGDGLRDAFDPTAKR